ncbi:MAG: hypothetical protein NDJ92_02770 [Thermoanaerobaculia bacterium]|nr:hypothetical protein [Thermoanaerobaculia bacterium]
MLELEPLPGASRGTSPPQRHCLADAGSPNPRPGHVARDGAAATAVERSK